MFDLRPRRLGGWLNSFPAAENKQRNRRRIYFSVLFYIFFYSLHFYIFHISVLFIFSYLSVFYILYFYILVFFLYFNFLCLDSFSPSTHQTVLSCKKLINNLCPSPWQCKFYKNSHSLWRWQNRGAIQVVESFAEYCFL